MLYLWKYQMKNITHILFLFLIFLVIPTSTILACENSSDKAEVVSTSCSKQDDHSEKKSCCDSGDESCDGFCNNNSCHCPVSVNTPIFKNNYQSKLNNNFKLLDNNWAYVQLIPKAVYISIWLPPNIS